ncbi:MAG: cob(I)yrinic acid a,c-diamide adenosyltransferase [Ardenticatenales bacterium]|nr:cob(I)yrinic acid a,c-diamide adenosyltransferase [Ardenticatenales bacterium]
MKIYTRTGDTGETGLFGGDRVPKTHPRVEAYGDVDELNSAIGLALALGGADAPGDLVAGLRHIQDRLFDLGADLATPSGTAAGEWLKRVPPEWATELEGEIDALSATLAPLTAFILPGGTPLAGALHLSRTVCRRAERRVLAAADAGEVIGAPVITYLNRLSDYLFVAARYANARAGVGDVAWRPGG